MQGTTRVAEKLKLGGINILFKRQEHQVEFPAGVEVFYVSPPAFGEINRWIRKPESQAAKQSVK